MSNQTQNVRMSYRRYKRRQRILAIALLLIILLMLVLGFTLGRASKDSYTIHQLPTDPEPSVDEIFSIENEHKCSNHTHQAYEEVVSYPDGSVLYTSSCIQSDDEAYEGAELEETSEVDASSCMYIELSDKEKHELATLIYLEGRGESVECQTAIGSVVLNRYTTGNYESLHDVIYAKGQFTPAYLIEDTEPTITQLQIVDDLCMNGPTIPEYVTFFRANRYFDWDTVSDYKCIDNTYFSANNKLKAKLQ